MNRLLAALSVLAVGCASTPTPPTVLGEPFAPGMYAVAADGVAVVPHKPARHPLASGPIKSATWVAYKSYQATLSRVDGATCRFRPTCSRLSYAAVSELGIAGVPIAFGRIQRLHSGVRHYPDSHPPHLHDPLYNYTFTNRRPKLDDMDAYESRAHAWYQHVRATKRNAR